MASSTELIVCIVMLLNANDCLAADCSLPEIFGNIDWDMLPGRWFQALNTHDVAESVVPCYLLENIHGDGHEGAYAELKAVTNATRHSETYAPVAEHWLHQQDGTYHLDSRNILTDKLKSLAKQRSARLLNKVMKEAKGFNQGPIAFLTDYKNYIAIMMCINNVKNMWLYGRNAHVTDDYVQNVADAINQAGEAWGKVSLYRAGCRNLQFFGHVI